MRVLTIIAFVRLCYKHNRDRAEQHCLCKVSKIILRLEPKLSIYWAYHLNKSIKLYKIWHLISLSISILQLWKVTKALKMNVCFIGWRLRVQVRHRAMSQQPLSICIMHCNVCQHLLPFRSIYLNAVWHHKWWGEEDQWAGLGGRIVLNKINTLHGI